MATKFKECVSNLEDVENTLQSIEERNGSVAEQKEQLDAVISKLDVLEEEAVKMKKRAEDPDTTFGPKMVEKILDMYASVTAAHSRLEGVKDIVQVEYDKWETEKAAEEVENARLAAEAQAAKEEAERQRLEEAKAAEEAEESARVKKIADDKAFAEEMQRRREEKKRLAEEEEAQKKKQEAEEARQKEEEEKARKALAAKTEKEEQQQKIQEHLARLKEENEAPKPWPQALEALRSGCDSEQFRTAIQFLHTTVSRVVAAPMEDSYRRVDISVMGNLPGGMPILRTLGFAIDPVAPTTATMTPSEALWNVFQEANASLAAETTRLPPAAGGASPSPSAAASPPGAASSTPPAAVPPTAAADPLAALAGLNLGGQGGGLTGLGGAGGVAGMLNNPMMQQMMQDPAMQAQMQQMQQQMMQDPAMMQQMLSSMGLGNNPAMVQQMQSAMSNPAAMQQMQSMMNNPAAMQQMQSMMSNPAAMQQMQSMMNNPAAMQQMQGLMGGMGGVGGMANAQNHVPPQVQTEEQMIEEAIRQSLGASSGSNPSGNPAPSTAAATPLGGSTSAEHGAVKMINTKAEFDAALVEAGDKLVVVIFSAKWCPPCQHMAPICVRLSEQQRGVVFLKVDVDENPQTKDACGITSMPTFQFYKAAAKVAEFSGANEAKLRSNIEQFKYDDDEDLYA